MLKSVYFFSNFFFLDKINYDIEVKLFSVYSSTLKYNREIFHHDMTTGTIPPAVTKYISHGAHNSLATRSESSIIVCNKNLHIAIKVKLAGTEKIRINKLRK